MISFPAIAPGPDVTLSASAYVAFRQCPDRSLARFRGEYGAESLPAFRGNLAHRLFARHLREGPIEAAGFARACREEIGASNLNHKLVELGIKPSVLRGVIEELGALYERFRRLPGEGFSGAEVHLAAEPAPGVKLVGIVDAVFRDGGRVRLVDWKTGGLGEAQHQLDFYALVWAMQFDAIPDLAEAVSVQTGERIDLRFSTADLVATAAEIGRIIDAVRGALRSGSQLAKCGGPWCRYCPILDSCTEGASAVALLASSGAGLGTE